MKNITELGEGLRRNDTGLKIYVMGDDRWSNTEEIYLKMNPKIAIRKTACFLPDAIAGQADREYEARFDRAEVARIYRTNQQIKMELGREFMAALQIIEPGETF